MMTILFAAVTACCLALLAVLALQIDGASRNQELTSNVTDRAGGLARAIYFDAGSLHLEPLREDELAAGASYVGVYRLGNEHQVTDTAYRTRQHGSSLPAAEQSALVADMLDEQGTVHRSSTGPAGHRVVWAAGPVWDDDTIRAVVVVGQDASQQTASHDRLAVGLAVGCLVLLGAAGAAGHLLSGRAMRPAVDALASQEQFLTEAAHELRTPLTALRLSVETGGTGGRERTLDSVDRVDRLISALLVRARIEVGSFEPEHLRLRLDQLVQQVVDESAAADQVELVTEPSIITGDPALLAQAIRNLIDNAVHHAHRTVQVSVRRRSIAVSDDGPGVPADQRQQVLEPGRGTGTGTGSGLAIVKWVVDLHHGTLTMSDTPRGGLTVTLAFPPSGQQD